MQQGTRTLVAAGVFLTGLTAALLFRHAPPAAPGPPAAEPLPPRTASVPLAPSVVSERPTARIESQGVPVPSERSQTPALRLPLDAGQPSPQLPKSYPGIASLPTTSSASARSDAPRRHKIVDGDTLETLAERYLGHAERAGELFDLNRDVLSNPELLPIGTFLRIPPRGPETSPQ